MQKTMRDAIRGTNGFTTLLYRAVVLAVILFPCMARAQDVEELKKGVVKITATVDGKTKIGTGFILRLEKDAAYIVTAAHVIEGDPHARVAFYPRANEFYQAEILGMEGGDPRGVAALVVKGRIPSDARAFAISTKTAVHGGESVTVIGFLGEAGTPWIVTTGTLGGRRGSDIAFSGVVGEGNSGGPLLRNGRVIGIIAQMGSKVSYAVPIISARFALEGWGIQLTESDEALLPKEIIGEDGATMVLVPAGEFPMGKEKQSIYLDAFYIDKDSTSQKRSWEEAAKYCRERVKRLPTEAEWEKAARSSNIRLNEKTSEWTSDWYQRDYPKIRPYRNPTGPTNGESNDDSLAQWEIKARSDAERSVELHCSGSSGHRTCFEGKCEEHPKCTASDRISRLEYELHLQREYWGGRPVRDMQKVIRSHLDIREGAFSKNRSATFRCVREPK